ncbi:transposase [Streptomyces sp. NPDC006290]|uniref:transposase n=1 Tax=unclassified Streptomyces TaxID=2593676 RepID=UPI0033A3D5AE
MCQGGADHDWLTIFQLPSYAPDLNPVEDVWSLLRRGPWPTPRSPIPNTLSAPSVADRHTSNDIPPSSMTASPKPAEPGLHCTSDTKGQ